MIKGLNDRWLTSKEVARLLGVSEASIKRWADRGLLPPVRTAGGHRRFRPDEVATFQRNKGLGGGLHQTAPQPSRPSSSPVGSATQGKKSKLSKKDREAALDSLFAALIEGQVEVVAAVLLKSYLYERQLAGIFDQLLSFPLRRIGELWNEGKLTIAQEHIATRTALTALQILHRGIEVAGGNGRLAICCATENDFHELGVQFTQILLESEGWSVLNLGPNTPFFALTEAMIEKNAKLVCVSSTILHNPDRAAREYKEFSERAKQSGVKIVLGGAGFASSPTRKRFPADLHADSFAQLSDFIRK
jgi:excisionase family DNA binding protein